MGASERESEPGTDWSYRSGSSIQIFPTWSTNVKVESNEMVEESQLKFVERKTRPRQIPDPAKLQQAATMVNHGIPYRQVARIMQIPKSTIFNYMMRNNLLPAPRRTVYAQQFVGTSYEESENQQ